MNGLWGTIRKWLGRLAWAVVCLNLLLAVEGVAETTAGIFPVSGLPTHGYIGYDRGPSPVREIGWVGVEEVTAGSPAAQAGLRPGDAVKFDALFGDSGTWRAGDIVKLTVDRDGHRFPVTVITKARTSAQTTVSMQDLFNVALESAFVAFSTLLLFHGRHNRAAAMLSIIVLFPIDGDLLWLPQRAFPPLAIFVLLPVKAAAVYCWPIFAMEISGGRASPRQARLVPAIATGYLVVFVLFMLSSAFRVPVPVPTGPIAIALYLSNVLFGLSIITRNFRRTDAAVRNRVKIVLAAFASLFFAITLIAAWQLLGLDSGPGREIIVWIVLLAAALNLGLLAYAVLGQRLFDFGFAINRTLVFGGVTFTLLIAFGLLEWSVEHFVPAAWREGGPYISAAIAVGVFLTFHRVRDWVERHIERLFFSSWHRAEAALRRFVESAGHFDKMPKLCSSFVQAVTSFAQGAAGALYIRERDGAYRLQAGKLAGAKRAYADDDPVFALMRGERKPIELSEAVGAVPGALALPMLDQGAMTGFVLLGAKPGGAAYRPDEIENLGWAAHQVGLDLRALQARELEEKVRTQGVQIAAFQSVLETLQPTREMPTALLSSGSGSETASSG